MARKLSALLLASALCSGALAADPAAAVTSVAQTGERTPARRRRTVIHFGEDDIRGDITRPDGELCRRRAESRRGPCCASAAASSIARCREPRAASSHGFGRRRTKGMPISIHLKVYEGGKLID